MKYSYPPPWHILFKKKIKKNFFFLKIPNYQKAPLKNFKKKQKKNPPKKYQIPKKYPKKIPKKSQTIKRHQFTTRPIYVPSLVKISLTVFVFCSGNETWRTDGRKDGRTEGRTDGRTAPIPISLFHFVVGDNKQLQIKKEIMESFCWTKFNLKFWLIKVATFYRY